MDLKTYLSQLSSDERQSLAERCDTSIGHLRNVAYGKSCAESLAINIERETSGKVRCETLRPDVDWAYIRSSSVQVDKEAA